MENFNFNYFKESINYIFLHKYLKFWLLGVIFDSLSHQLVRIFIGGMIYIQTQSLFLTIIAYSLWPVIDILFKLKFWNLLNKIGINKGYYFSIPAIIGYYVLAYNLPNDNLYWVLMIGVFFGFYVLTYYSSDTRISARIIPNELRGRFGFVVNTLITFISIIGPVIATSLIYYDLSFYALIFSGLFFSLGMFFYNRIDLKLLNLEDQKKVELKQVIEFYKKVPRKHTLKILGDSIRDEFLSSIYPVLLFIILGSSFELVGAFTFVMFIIILLIDYHLSLFIDKSSNKKNLQIQASAVYSTSFIGLLTAKTIFHFGIFAFINRISDKISNGIFDSSLSNWLNSQEDINIAGIYKNYVYNVGQIFTYLFFIICFMISTSEINIYFYMILLILISLILLQINSPCFDKSHKIKYKHHNTH